MKLSDSIGKEILTGSVGRITNRFKIHQRRYVLFFEDIIAEYVKACEEKGMGDDVAQICTQWMNLVTQVLTPTPLKKLPPVFFLNNVAKAGWNHIGVVEDFKVEEKDGAIKIRSKNEFVTRIIGKNSYDTGLIAGVFSSLWKHEMRCVKADKDGQWMEYVFEIQKKPMNPVKSKTKAEYDRLNYFPEYAGVGFKEALRTGFFRLGKSNRIYFRNKSVIMTENTQFHLFANRNVAIEKLPDISYRFFHSLVDKGSPDETKITLLKNILQSMGWGLVEARIERRDKITMEIKYPPHGLQNEKDNWGFITQVILGYMRLIDRKIKITKTKQAKNSLSIDFSV